MVPPQPPHVSFPFVNPPPSTTLHILYASLSIAYAGPDAACMQVHEDDFVTRFSNGTLSEMEMRRIGFGEVTRHPYLIERTKAEVAGAALSFC